MLATPLSRTAALLLSLSLSSTLVSAGVDFTNGAPMVKWAVANTLNCQSVLPTADGTNAFWVVCTTNSNGNYLVKYSVSGSLLTSVTHGAGEFNKATIDSRNGDVYVVGMTYSNWGGQTIAGNSDSFLFKVNSAGTVQWTKFFGTSNHDGAYAVAIDTVNNRAVVTGYSSSNVNNGPWGSSTARYYVAAFSTSNGASAWSNDAETSGYTYGQSVVIATGYIYTCGLSSNRAIWFKHSLSGGGYLSRATFTQTSECRYVDYDSALGYLVTTGWIGAQLYDWTVYNGGRDAFIVNLNPSSLAQVNRGIIEGAGGDEEAYGVYVDTSRNVEYWFGSSTSADWFSLNQGSLDMFVINTISDTMFWGWATQSGTSGNDVLFSMRGLENRAIVMSGRENNVGYVAMSICPAGKYTGDGVACTNCPPGQWSLPGASSCSASLCPAGSRCNNGVMSTCAAGYWSSVGSSTCSTCSAGTFSAAGSATCTTCAAGKYSAAASSSCTNCGAGTWSNAGSSTCSSALCLAGSFCLGNGVMTTCGTGTWSSAGSSSCTNCVAGKASSTTGAGSISTCTNCPAGSWSNAGSATCTLTCTAGNMCPGDGTMTQCAAGKFSAAGASSCSNCAAGSWSSVGSTSCSLTCTPGSFCAGNGLMSTCGQGTWSAAGASSCTSCAAGKFSAATGATSSTTCANCAAGAWSSSGAASCTACPAGSMCPGDGTTTQCAAGKFAAAGSSSCSNCAAGTWSSAGSTSCAAGSCPAGSMCPGDGTTTQCAAGKFSGAGASSCSNCAAGTWSNVGSSSCSLSCTAGRFCAGNGVMTTCVAGTWSAAGASSCTNCAAGKFSAATGAVSIATCSNCVPGLWSTAGSSSCTLQCTAGSACPGDGTMTLCAAGKFSLASASTCSSCVAGRISSVGATTCTACAAGTFTSDQITCKDCLAGTFSSSGASTCTSCSTGSWSTAKASSCTACVDGSVSTSSGCETCPLGSIVSGTTCAQCEAGKFTNDGLTCKWCTAGSWSAAGSTECTQCEAGTYTTDLKNCVACASNTFSTAGSSSCTDCDEGFQSNAGASKCEAIDQIVLVAKTEAPKKTVATVAQTVLKNQNIDSQSAYNVNGTLVLFIGIAVLIFVLILIATFLCIRRYRKTTETAGPMTATAGSYSVVLDPYNSSQMLNEQVTQMSIVNPNLNATLTNITSTMVDGKAELSIPSFLCKVVNNDFAVGQEIAHGSLGTIHACEATDMELLERSQGVPLVIKITGDNMRSIGEQLQAGFYQELSLMWLLRDHPNVAKVFGYSQKPVGLIMKYYGYGDLYAYILQRSPTHLDFPYTKARLINVMKGFASAIGYMHYVGVAHADVKPQNVLLDVVNNNGFGQLTAVVTDMGITRILDQRALAVVDRFEISELRGASISYAAPDAITRLRQRFIENNPTVWKAGDTYSLAVCLFQALVRRNVWPKIKPTNNTQNRNRIQY